MIISILPFSCHFAITLIRFADFHYFIIDIFITVSFSLLISFRFISSFLLRHFTALYISFLRFSTLSSFHFIEVITIYSFFAFIRRHFAIIDIYTLFHYFIDIIFALDISFH
jgi:hypothetical protein